MKIKLWVIWSITDNRIAVVRNAPFAPYAIFSSKETAQAAYSVGSRQGIQKVIELSITIPDQKKKKK